jgi:thiol-disulfide isomerase/thioredoxin
MKFFAGYCRACRALEPKLLAVKDDPQLNGLPIIWAEFESKPDNRQVFKDLSIVTLPTIHFYDGQTEGALDKLEL